MKALIIENVPVMQRILRRVLTMTGFREEDIYEASNGPEALTVIKNDPDLGLILSDWYMPGMLGIELLRILRKELRLETPFIMVTSALRREDVMEAVSLGVSAYVAKPFTLAILQSRIRKALGNDASTGSPADVPAEGHAVSDTETEGVSDRGGLQARGDPAPA